MEQPSRELPVAGPESAPVGQPDETASPVAGSPCAPVATSAYLDTSLPGVVMPGVAPEGWEGLL